MNSRKCVNNTVALKKTLNKTTNNINALCAKYIFF